MTSISYQHTQSPSQTVSWKSYESSDRDLVLPLWRQLEFQIQETSVASSSTWVECWLQVFGDLIPHRFWIAESTNEICGIALIVEGVGQKEGPFSMRTLHVGTAGEPSPGSVCVEYNRLLCKPQFEHAFLLGLIQQIRSDRKWEQFKLDGFAEQELQPWRNHFPKGAVRTRESCYFDFEAARNAGSDVISQLGSSTRSNLRRKLKKYGELNIQWAESADQAEDFLLELIDLHQARWNSIGHPGAFASPRFKQFQTESALRLFIENKAVLFRVQHQDETVGCLYLLNDRNRLLDYLSGFASFEVKSSPGLITHYLCMVEAMKRGFSAYDFLVGEKQHKQNLSNSSTNLCWLTETRPSLKNTALTALRAVKSTLQRGRNSVRSKKNEIH